MKECLACHAEKDVMAFYNLYDDDNTFHSVCKACRSNGEKEPEHVTSEYKKVKLESYRPPVRKTGRRGYGYSRRK